MLGWIARYAKILAKCPELTDPETSILEIGCGAHGIARYTTASVTGLERDRINPAEENLNLVIGSILIPPFSEESFDYVICVDVLEHIKQDERLIAVKSMAGIAKKKVIISCPIRDEAEEFEKWLSLWFKQKMGRDPQWLEEHLQNGLPSLSEMVNILNKSGFQYQFYPNEGIQQHYAGILLDYTLKTTSSLTERITRKAPHESPISGSEWDLSYSYIFEINKLKTIPSSQIQGHHANNSRPTKNLASSEHSNIGFYCFFHSTPPPINIPNHKLIKCGEATIEAASANLDFTSDIPAKTNRLDNKRWSELSGIYKLWADQELPHVIGLSHYRRYLLPGIQNSNHIRTEEASEILQKLNELNLEKIANECIKNNVIYIPIALNLGRTIYKQYSECCNEQDLCLMITILTDLYPEYYELIPAMLESDRLHAWNIGVMSKRNFNDLWGFVFSVLLEFEKERPHRHVNNYQARDISFLAERLTHLWYLKAEIDESAYIQKCPIIYNGKTW